jgi:hypothetical protein
LLQNELAMHRGGPPFGAAPSRPGIRRRASARPAARGWDQWAQWAADGRILAVVLGVLAAFGLLGATLSFTVDLFIAPWRLFTADVEESLHLLASAIGLAGAFQLWRAGRRGRPPVLVSLGLNVVATLAFSARALGNLETLAPMLTWLVLGVLTVASRWAEPRSGAAVGQMMGPEVPQWPDWRGPPGPPH